jgi:hypothetical protein
MVSNSVHWTLDCLLGWGSSVKLSKQLRILQRLIIHSTQESHLYLSPIRKENIIEIQGRESKRTVLGFDRRVVVFALMLKVWL